MKSKPILLFQRIVPSYRVPIFRYLHEEFNMVVCHSKEAKKGKIISDAGNMDYPNESIARFYYQKEETSVIQNVWTPLINYRPKVVISPFSAKYLTFWILLILRPFFRYKLIVWSHGIKSSEISEPFQSLRGKISRWVYNHADANIIYSRQIKKIFDIHIKTPSFVAQNTLDISHYKSLLESLRKRGIQQIRNELGFTTKYHIVFISRLLPNKRIDLLLEAFTLLKEKHDISLHIIGGGPEMGKVEIFQQQTPDIFAYGAIYDDEITSKLLYGSDFMLIPGYVGLSIVHAFAFGVPLITCKPGKNGPFHAPEIEYLEEGKNGLFCEPNSLNIALKIEALLLDSQQLTGMKEYAHKTVEDKAGVELFMKGFRDAIHFVLSSKQQV